MTKIDLSKLMSLFFIFYRALICSISWLGVRKVRTNGSRQRQLPCHLSFEKSPMRLCICKCDKLICIAGKENGYRPLLFRIEGYPRHFGFRKKQLPEHSHKSQDRRDEHHLREFLKSTSYFQILSFCHFFCIFTFKRKTNGEDDNGCVDMSVLP